MGKMHIITHVNVNPRFLISQFSHVSFDTKQVHILGRCWYNNLHPSFLPSFLSPLKKRIKNKWNPNGYLQPVTEFKSSHPLICTHHESKYFRINIIREQRVFFIQQQQIHRPNPQIQGSSLNVLPGNSQFPEKPAQPIVSLLCHCGDDLIPFVLCMKIHPLILPQLLCDLRKFYNTPILLSTFPKGLGLLTGRVSSRSVQHRWKRGAPLWS